MAYQPTTKPVLAGEAAPLLNASRSQQHQLPSTPQQGSFHDTNDYCYSTNDSSSTIDHSHHVDEQQQQQQRQQQPQQQHHNINFPSLPYNHLQYLNNRSNPLLPSPPQPDYGLDQIDEGVNKTRGFHGHSHGHHNHSHNHNNYLSNYQYGSLNDDEGNNNSGNSQQQKPSPPTANSSLQHVRDAFHHRDILSTIQHHNNRLQQSQLFDNQERLSQETNQEKLSLLTSIISAVISTFLILIIGYTLNLSFYVTNILLLSQIIGGFAQSCNTTLKDICELVFIESEVNRESWEMDVNMIGEIEEMVAIYTEKGMDQGDAQQIWEIMANYKDIFLDAMLAAECRILRPETTTSNKHKIFRHTLFYIYGIILTYFPNLIFTIVEQFSLSFQDKSLPIVVTSIWTTILLFYLGVTRANIYSKTPRNIFSIFNLGQSFDGISLNLSIQTVVIGIICGVFAFCLGRASTHFIPPQELYKTTGIITQHVMQNVTK